MQSLSLIGEVLAVKAFLIDWCVVCAVVTAPGFDQVSNCDSGIVMAMNNALLSYKRNQIEILAG